MITFNSKDFDEILPEIRAEFERTRSTTGVGNDIFFILSTEEYAMLRSSMVVKFDEAPIDFVDEMLAQLDATIARGDTAEKAG